MIILFVKFELLRSLGRPAHEHPIAFIESAGYFIGTHGCMIIAKIGYIDDFKTQSFVIGSIPRNLAEGRKCDPRIPSFVGPCTNRFDE